jgi:hypothetical protein
MEKQLTSLRPYEARVLEALSRKFSLEEKLTGHLAENLNLLARLFERVVSDAEPEIRAGRIVIIGLINHVHCLLAGGLQALEVGNGGAWSACGRGLIETLGACVRISERPNSAPSYLDHIEAGKLYTAAERAHPELREDIKRLHQIVHPASGAIYACTSVLDESKKMISFEFGLQQPDAAEGREGIIFLANLALLIVDQFAALVSNGAVFSTGKVIVERVSKPA